MSQDKNHEASQKVQSPFLSDGRDHHRRSRWTKFTIRVIRGIRGSYASCKSERFLDIARNDKRILAAMVRSKISAGLLMFRRNDEELEVLLVHPGGPYFQNKDEGAWTIPKGETVEGEDLLARARIEFEEELGIPAAGDWIKLGHIKQKGGKTVHAWAFAGDLKDDFKLASNTFEMEWPPRSGKMQRFPEVDRASFFPVTEARRKINVAQSIFLDRLIQQLDLRRTREV